MQEGASFSHRQGDRRGGQLAARMPHRLGAPSALALGRGEPPRYARPLGEFPGGASRQKEVVP
eukprot:3626880-Pyramimonas_sp.AAC.1